MIKFDRICMELILTKIPKKQIKLKRRKTNKNGKLNFEGYGAKAGC